MRISEELANKHCIYKTTEKNGEYRIYLTEYPQKTYYLIAYYLTDQPIFNMVYYQKDLAEEKIKKEIKKIITTLYTEEELLSPCNSLKEFEKRESFFLNNYIKQFPCNDYTDLQLMKRDGCIILPSFNGSSWITVTEDKKVATKIIDLYKKLQMLRKPTIFPKLSNNLSTLCKAVQYMSLIEFAEPDDFCLPDVEDYLARNSNKIILDAYCRGQYKFCVEMVIRDYIKTPTMQKLFKLASKNEDTKLVAILLDKLENNSNKRSKFTL